MKHRALIKRWVVWIRTSTLVRCLLKNYNIWRQRNKEKINEIFLAIKFKIRFKVRFDKQFGREYDER